MKGYYLLLIFSVFFGCNGNAQREQDQRYEVSKTEAEWKAELSPQEFDVLRKKGTERAFSSELNNIEAPGTFVCAACGNALYKTKNKFDSGTGWPSFDQPINEDHVNYRADRIGGFSAIEVVCATCGSHLGHVFNDGPKATTGKRHCINGVAMKFIPNQ
jgi:peptide-methionine (R)-S-oxide reductase